MYEDYLDLTDIMPDFKLALVNTASLLKCQAQLQKIEINKIDKIATEEQKRIIRG